MKNMMYGAFLVLAVSFAAHAHGGQLSIVIDGRAVSTIVVPKDAGSWTNKAAQWLQEYIRKASGAELKIMPEDKAPSGTLISVGHTEIAAKAGVDIQGLKYDGCKLIVKDNIVFLIGRDSEKIIENQPLAGARGNCRAVLTFLEEFCGIRWFLPGPEGEYVPKSETITVPDGYSMTFVPAFAYSDGRFPYDYGYLANGGGTPGAIINNFRKAVLAIPGGHTYYHAVPSEEYFDDHPEYFALIDGKRTGEGNHLCTSNPDVKNLLVRYTQEKFDEGWEWMTVGQEDGYVRCECPECESLDNFRWAPGSVRWEDFQNNGLRETPCERLFITHKWVIDEVKKSHPDKKVMLMCYAPTAWPSKNISYFGDNVICEIMNQSPEYIKAWSAKFSGMTCYFYLFDNQCPMGFNVTITPGEIAGKVRYLHENGFVGIYHLAESDWGLQGPSIYVFGRMMGDPSLDHEALVKEYCNGVFGKAGGTMLEFFGLLFARLEEVLPLPVDDFSGRNIDLPRWMNTTDMFLMQYPPTFLAQLEELIQKAEKEADTERTRGWVRLSRDHFDFVKLLTQTLISYRAWQSNKSTENWHELKERVETFDAYRLKIITYPKEYTDVWFPGHPYFCQWMTADIVSESEIYYSPWENRKPDVLKRGIKGMAMGYGDSYYYSFIKEPLTLDFSKPE